MMANGKVAHVSIEKEKKASTKQFLLARDNYIFCKLKWNIPPSFVDFL